MFNYDLMINTAFALEKGANMKDVKFYRDDDQRISVLNSTGNLWLADRWGIAQHEEKLSKAVGKDQIVMEAIDNLAKALDKVSLPQRIGLWLIRR